MLKQFSNDVKYYVQSINSDVSWVMLKKLIVMPIMFKQLNIDVFFFRDTLLFIWQPCMVMKASSNY